MPAKRPPKAPPALTVWENATGVAQAAQPGLIPAHHGGFITFVLTIVLLAVLMPTQGAGLPALALSLLFARLIALEFTSYTLPNIYTVPLLAVGCAHAALHGLFLQFTAAALLLLAVALLLPRLRPQAGFGGGDFKLLAAYFAFFPVQGALLTLGLACLLYLPLGFAFPRRPVPFGVPLILAWVLLLAFPTLPNWVFSTIS
ncbi:MAG: hypothetical protein GC129_05795 [Proteobacteria bacterium]|nr:hypothetical protein [Pseudomonadota bacterium]